MAENFGPYSVIPKSTGIGQGAAQVLNPQVVLVDARGLAQGIASAGESIGAGMIEAQRRADAQAAAGAKERDKDTKEITDFAKGDYRVFNEKREQVVGDYRDRVAKASTEAEREQIKNETIVALTRLKEAEDITKADIAARMKEGYAYKPHSEEGGGWVPANTRAFENVGRALTEEEREMSADVFASMFMKKQLETETLNPSEKFNLGADVLKEFNQYLPQSGMSQESISEIANSGGVYNIAKVTSKMRPEEVESFRNYLKSPDTGGALKEKWAQSYALENGLSMSTIRTNPDMVQMQWEEVVDNMILPTREKTQLRITKKPKDTEAEEKGFKVTTLENNDEIKTALEKSSETAKREINSLMNDAAQLEKKASETDKPEEKKALLEQAKLIRKSAEDAKSAHTKAEENLTDYYSFCGRKDVHTIAITPKKAGDKTPEVTAGSYRGELSQLSVGEKGDGWAIINVPIASSGSYSESSKDPSGTTNISERESAKIFVPTPVKATANDITKWQELYQVNIRPEMKEELVEEVDEFGIKIKP